LIQICGEETEFAKKKEKKKLEYTVLYMKKEKKNIYIANNVQL
jgi:hypothetical protein